MVKSIISADRRLHSNVKEGLAISEFYYDTIQGEGIHIGHPAAFLRLSHCTLNCDYCDTKGVWTRGSVYSIDDLMDEIEYTELPTALANGQHLVITGGSPLLQQKKIVEFIQEYSEVYYKPFIEIENECVLMPIPELAEMVNCWNNSPKLSSSGMTINQRYKPDVIRTMANLPNSYFKFVISAYTDWMDVENDFLRKGLISRDQIILMPQGATREELEKNREQVINIAIDNGVRFTDRLHITIWDKKVGI